MRSQIGILLMMKEGRTILWAEDDQNDIDTILAAASELNADHLIDFATNGEEVLINLMRCILNKSLPELIVLDNNMPRMTGMETLKEILKHPQLQHIPVVFFTTTMLPSDKKITRDQAHNFVKPADYITFRETVQHILDFRHSPPSNLESS